MDGLFPGRPQSFQHQRRPVVDCSPEHRGMAQDGGTRDGTFHGEMNRCRSVMGGLGHAVVCPNVTGRTKEDSPKQAGSCWLACHS